jgi:protein-S-isoprenylcysteine O-methyltransferase Ste14
LAAALLRAALWEGTERPRLVGQICAAIQNNTFLNKEIFSAEAHHGADARTRNRMAQRKGVYKISRHPQIVALFVIFTGICLAIGSWIALFALILSRVLQHFSILAEEEDCLRRYGESYRNYMEQIPRYFLFF